MRVDPRTRLALVIVAAPALAVTSGLLPLAATVAALLAATLLAGHRRALRDALRIVVPMALLVFAIAAYGGGPAPALAAALRLAAIVTAAVLALAGTSPVAMGNALVCGGLPYPAAFVVMTATHFVPVLARRAAAVRDAQRARGIPLDAGVRGLAHAPAMVLPVLYQSFKLADDLAEALESRGFARPGRTFRHAYRLGALDWSLILVATVASAAYVRSGGW